VTTSLLLTNAYIHSVAEPYATALHIDNGVVAWLGADETAQQMVEATTTGPVETHHAQNMLITPAFVDGLTRRELADGDPRVMISATQPTDNGVYYAPAETADATSGGLFIAAAQLDRLGEVAAQIAPPTQLLIESTSAEDVEHILSILEQQPNTALMRSRHRIVLNHQLDAEQIRRLVTVHASVTLVPALEDDRPVFYAPTASLISEGVHVAVGTGDWSGTLWDVLTALIEHADQEQRVSTRAAFNTVTRDGIRVLPSKVSQANMAAGQLGVGTPANLNIWRAEQLGVQAPDVRAAHWSTDKRAGTALLPILSSEEPMPELVGVIRNGQMS
jgi:hypothetical protein